MRILSFLILLIPGLAFGQLTQNLFIDTKAMSLGNAVTADPVGLMSIHFNPAGLTKLDGRQIQISFMNIVLDAEAEFSLPDHYEPGDAGLLRIHEDKILGECDPSKPTSKGKCSSSSKATAAAYLPGVGIMPMHLPVLTLPSGGLSIQPAGSKFTFANAAYAPMTAGFAKEDDDPGR